MAAPRFVKRILQEHVWSGQLVDNAEIAGRTPELREPTTYDDFILLFPST
jgi:hypothetical protein